MEDQITQTTWNLTHIDLTTQRNLITSKPKVTDIEISQSQTPKLITTLAKEINILDQEIDQYGKYKAKISTDTLQRLHNQPNGKYILVTGITPTPLGEGKKHYHNRSNSSASKKEPQFFRMYSPTITRTNIRH